MRKVKHRTAIGLATVLVLLLAWYLATDVAGLIDRQRFPAPAISGQPGRRS